CLVAVGWVAASVALGRFGMNRLHSVNRERSTGSYLHFRDALNAEKVAGDNRFFRLQPGGGQQRDGRQECRKMSEVHGEYWSTPGVVDRQALNYRCKLPPLLALGFGDSLISDLTLIGVHAFADGGAFLTGALQA